MLWAIIGAAVLVAFLGGGALFLVRRARRTRAQFEAELATQQVLIGPESALYRGGTGGYPGVKGNGLIALTTEQLRFRILVGTSLDIPLREITGLREDKTFKGARVGGRVHLIVQTATGEAGFFVGDNAKWIAALSSTRER